MNEFDELTPQARAARVTYLLTQRRAMTTGELMEAAGLGSGRAVRYLMSNLTQAGLPIDRPAPGRWVLLNERDES